ncbi:efflux transporter outer membrane subunit [Mucilaginibacter sp. cycad4]|uniref:efflux transporter outer membrane subunit n=1 Tax=Mucilaginibacter sp. cycad4 TaxID=3342096 RepID=UPI002AAA7874|nr:efflux transporter outer membrane subunit [Mucilaginibacter gossypii]WPU99139.1 efflux transporter outer membrane subunit [Mucilaginibacter gossypii]
MKTLKKHTSLVVLLTTVAIFAGCKVSKDVTVKDVRVPEAYANTTTDTSSIARLPWEKFFNDPELNQLISDAINHNFDLQVAIKDIDAAAQVLKQSKWNNVPAVNAQATANTSRPSDNSLNGLSLGQYLNQKHIEDYTVSASLSWEADLWGKIRSQSAGALAAYLKTQEATKAVQTKIVNDVAKGYYNLLMLDEQLQIARQNVALNDSTLSMIKLQYAAGKVTSLAIQQANAQRLEAAGLVPQFEEQLNAQQNALCILTGKYPAEIPHKRRLTEVSSEGILAAGVPADLLGNRPDIKLAELDIEQQNAAVGYAKASMYPSLTITAQGGLDAFKASNWFNIPSSLFGAVTAGLAQPLLNQRRLKTNYEVAKVRREQSVIRFRQSVLAAVGEVSDDLVKINKFREKQNLATERVSTLELATRNSQMLFGNGLATYLEVITAQSSVLQSQLELSSVKKSELDARVDLYRAVGGGWRSAQQ